METILIDCREDFIAAIIFTDHHGQTVPPEDIDFSATFSSSGVGEFIVEKYGQQCSGCFIRDSRLYIDFRDHDLPEGQLSVTFDSIPPDIAQVSALIVPRAVGVELVPPDATLVLPADTQFAVEVKDEDHMQSIIQSGYSVPGTLYFTVDPSE